MVRMGVASLDLSPIVVFLLGTLLPLTADDAAA